MVTNHSNHILIKNVKNVFFNVLKFFQIIFQNELIENFVKCFNSIIIDYGIKSIILFGLFSEKVK